MQAVGRLFEKLEYELFYTEPVYFLGSVYFAEDGANGVV